ncbi:MAG: serine/threonine protein kinase [Alphaproteobacteria bacterium]|nr:serine/threonine protein kinase [Alphaproteobacteria bacterium]
MASSTVHNDPVDEDHDPPTENTDAAPGRGGRLVADRYAVRYTIARGGMGEVVLAQHVDLERFVALKILAPPRHSGSLDFEDRFRREARTLASFDHPHIVTLYDFGVLDDGRAFLAMEYIDGPRLTDLLRDGPMHPLRVGTLICQVGRALRYAHKRGVIHRDLKPSNILVRKTDNGEPHVKLVDFGIAKVERDPEHDTGHGVLLGSPHYMAPEQIDGIGVDPRTDVYAVGVLMFRMLTGTYPFHGPTTMSVLMAHLDAPVPAFADAAPHVQVPADVEAVVRRCLAKRQDDRYANMDAMMADLAGAVGLPTSAWQTGSFARPAASTPMSAAITLDNELTEASTHTDTLSAPVAELAEQRAPRVEAPPAPFPTAWAIAAAVTMVLAAGLTWFVATAWMATAAHTADADVAAEAPRVLPPPPPLLTRPEGEVEAPPDPAPVPAKAPAKTPSKPAAKAAPKAAPSRATAAPSSQTAPKATPKAPPKAAPKATTPADAAAPTATAEPAPAPRKARAPEGYQGVPDDL